MAIVDRVKRELKRNKKKDDHFQAQLTEFREFQSQLRAAGINPQDQYEMPLMLRLGSQVST